MSICSAWDLFSSVPPGLSGTSRGMTTTAKREGDTWVINGQKRWIGNSTLCDPPPPQLSLQIVTGQILTRWYQPILHHARGIEHLQVVEARRSESGKLYSF